MSVVDYLKYMVPFMIAALPITFLLRFIILKKRKAVETTTALHEIGIMILVAFAVGLASVTIDFAHQYTLTLANNGHFSFKIFNVFKITYYEVKYNKNYTSLYINVFGNILMFVPFGFIFPLLWKKIKFFRTTLICLMLSICIECYQLFIPRQSDIDDIWLNVLGGILGYLLYKLVSKKAPVFCEKFKAKAKYNSKNKSVKKKKTRKKWHKTRKNK